MDEPTVLPTETETVPATEPPAVETEETYGPEADDAVTEPPTVPETAETTEPEATETAPEQTETEAPETEPEETEAYEDIPETTEVVAVEYVEVIENSTGILANVILCAALILVGFFAAMKFWGAK